MGKKISKGIGIILIVLIVSIVLHIYLPGDATANSVAFDSGLVKAIGFEAVATLYFLIFYLHLYIAFYYLLLKSKLSCSRSALRLGLGFSALPMFGMLEIAPDTIWTLKVALNQIFIGLSDALPGLLLAFLIYQFCFRKSFHKISSENKDTYKNLKLQKKSKVMLTILVAVVFIVERFICYYTGITLSAIKEYPIPCTIWTVLFGICLGIACTILYPVYASLDCSRSKRVGAAILSLGLNWIWFNNFIALIAKGMVLQMTVRSSMDILVIVLAIVLMKGKICYEEV